MHFLVDKKGQRALRLPTGSPLTEYLREHSAAMSADADKEALWLSAGDYVPTSRSDAKEKFYVMLWWGWRAEAQVSVEAVCPPGFQVDLLSDWSQPEEVAAVMTTASAGRLIGFPGVDEMDEDDIPMGNLEYVDLRSLNVDDVRDALRAEDRVLPWLLADKGRETYDDEMNEVMPDECYWLQGLEPGVASTVAALAAIGAWPLTSCAAGPDEGHEEPFPLVVCWLADQIQAAAVIRAAEAVLRPGSPGLAVESSWHGHVVLSSRAGELPLFRAFAIELCRSAFSDFAP